MEENSQLSVSERSSRRSPRIEGLRLKLGGSRLTSRRSRLSPDELSHVPVVAEGLDVILRFVDVAAGFVRVGGSCRDLPDLLNLNPPGVSGLGCP